MQKTKQKDGNFINNLNEIAKKSNKPIKYNPDNIFNKKMSQKADNMQMIEYKRNIFQKILNKIYKIL